MQERIFSGHDLPNITVYIAGGIYIASENRPSLTFNHADIALNGIAVWHQAGATNEQLPVALTLRSDPSVKAIAALNDVHTAEDTLPLVFSQYLTELRTKNKSMRLSCVVSDARPDVPPGYVRLPHLVAYRKDDQVTDKTMWESLTVEEAVRWLGSTLPEQKLIEESLPILLALRRMVRSGQPVNNDACNGIVEALKHEQRYLSILFVYQHIDLFHALFEQWHTIQSVGDAIE